jgi:hypothetical protein
VQNVWPSFAEYSCALQGLHYILREKMNLKKNEGIKKERQSRREVERKLRQEKILLSTVEVR